jgi:hypothetical protein
MAKVELDGLYFLRCGFFPTELPALLGVSVTDLS